MQSFSLRNVSFLQVSKSFPQSQSKEQLLWALFQSSKAPNNKKALQTTLEVKMGFVTKNMQKMKLNLIRSSCKVFLQIHQGYSFFSWNSDSAKLCSSKKN